MSYNFLSFFPNRINNSKYAFKIKKNYELFSKYRQNLPDRWYFVEFEKYILIEIEWIALTCYADIVAVYDHNGKLINPKFSKNKNYNDLLEIHPIFKIMIGIKGSKRLEKPKDLDNVVNYLTQNALILMKFNFLTATRDRYNLSTELVKVLDNLTIETILENFKNMYVSCKNSSNIGEQHACSSEISTAVDFILQKRINDYPQISHTETKKIENINVKMRGQLYGYKINPREPIIEYKLSELKKTIIDYINIYISTTKSQLSPVAISLSGTGGGRSHNSMKISYNDQYIMNKNNYILLVHLHK